MPADRGDRAAEWLQAWDSQGFHRTATEGDEAGAGWLTVEAERMGAQVDAEVFALSTVSNKSRRPSSWTEFPSKDSRCLTRRIRILR